MARDWSEEIAIAQELIAFNGRQVTFEQLDATPVDPEKPWIGPGSPTVRDSIVVNACFVASHRFNFGRDGISDELLSRVKEVALVAQCPKDLEAFNLIRDADGSSWNIQWFQTLKPANDVLLYYFGVSR